jgi:hypothetical protein
MACAVGGCSKSPTTLASAMGSVGVIAVDATLRCLPRPVSRAPAQPLPALGKRQCAK